MKGQKSVTLSSFPASSQHHSVADNIFLQTLPITSALTNQLQSATKVNNLSTLDLQFRNDLLKTLSFPQRKWKLLFPELWYMVLICRKSIFGVMVQSKNLKAAQKKVMKSLMYCISKQAPLHSFKDEGSK